MSDFSWSMACAAEPSRDDKVVTLAHGEGALLSRQLIQRRIAPALASSSLDVTADAATVHVDASRLAVTTDSFVVSPLFFPGGDIGRLAVYGTCNDLAVSCARPRWLTLSLIVEEGLPLATLDRILASIREAAETSRVEIITGDFKVVPRAAADQLFINTTGLGELVAGEPVGPRQLRAGDVLLVSGPVGRHGMAVLNARESLGFEPPIVSDCGPLWPAVERLLAAKVPVRAVRDATRGGVAAVLHEWAEASGLSIVVDEATVPVTQDVRGACELLGLDPLYVANEGTMVVAVDESAAEQTRALLRSHHDCGGAEIIGRTRPQSSLAVAIRRGMGSEHPLDEPLGAPLPRIC